MMRWSGRGDWIMVAEKRDVLTRDTKYAPDKVLNGNRRPGSAKLSNTCARNPDGS